MTHEDAGHYALKHKTRELDKTIEMVLQKKTKNGKITCASAHSAARELGITPKEAGIQADLMELRLIKCSMGLFGYEPDGKILNKNIKVSKELDKKIEDAAKDGRIICRACWEIAKTMKLSRVDVASACDSKGVKIKNCQLGAF
ncbi:MAG: hypothetical protein U9N77_12790 [Thermodesulfobacteriota bacterium]|nr:hypothetical protein [Thermodesulfobacteriota bacterium]